MIRRHPRSTRTDTLFPYTTLFRSYGGHRSLDRWRNRGGRAWRPCPLLCVALSGCFSKEKRTPPEILTERPAISLVATVRPTHNSSRPPCRVDLLPQGCPGLKHNAQTSLNSDSDLTRRSADRKST